MAFSQAFVLVDHAKHDLKSFDCGKPDMNKFLARFAAKHMKLGVSRTWVLTVSGKASDKGREAPKMQVAAYYSLTFDTVARDEIPFKASLPAYPVPVAVIARLAVDKQFQRQKLGEKTLISALRKSAQLTDAGLPAIGVILDVLDENALTFYQKYDIFEAFTNDPMRLFTPMHLVKQI